MLGINVVYNMAGPSRYWVLPSLVSTAVGLLMLICLLLRSFIFFYVVFRDHSAVEIEYRPFSSAETNRGETVLQKPNKDDIRK